MKKIWIKSSKISSTLQGQQETLKKLNSPPENTKELMERRDRAASQAKIVADFYDKLDFQTYMLYHEFMMMINRTMGLQSVGIIIEHDEKEEG